jgi:pimeloyl-ACP methyl ester carboxylesterase
MARHPPGRLMAKPPLERQWRMVGGLAVHARVADRVPTWFPAVALVHGLGVSSRYMAALARQLAPFYRVFAIDLPGFGRSERPPRPLGLVELAEALASWMRATGLRSATLVGNSYGCQVAVELAARRPRLVERLVLIGPSTDPAYRTRRQQISRLLLDAVREPMSLVGVAVSDYVRCGPRVVLKSLADALAHPLEARLPLVVAPALVMRGMRDPLVSAAWAERVASELPAGRLAVVPGAAHAAHYAAPRSVARTIRRFIDEQPASRLAVA